MLASLVCSFKLLIHFLRAGPWLGAAFCLIPLVALAFYSHPSLDDFAIGEWLRHFTIVQYVSNTYQYRSGRYSSSLFSVVIQLFGRYPGAYKGLILGGLLAFVGSLGAVAASTVRNTGCPAGRGWELASLLTTAAVVNFPHPAEGIFWLTGSVAYLYPVTLAALLCALLTDLYRHPTGRYTATRWWLALLLGFLIPGFSEITALLLPLVCGGIFLVLKPRPAARGWYGVAGAILFGSLLNLGSPSHWVQWSTLAPAKGDFSLLKSLALGMFGVSYSVVNWLGNGLLPLLTLLALPVAEGLTSAAKRSLLERLTRRVWLWPALMLAGLWLAFFFCFAATSQGPALRVKNLLYLYFLACWLLSAYAVARRLDAQAIAWLCTGPLRLALVGWLLVAFATDHNTHLTHEGIGRQTNTVVQAYRDWLSGDAARYDAAQRARYDALRATAAPNVGLPPLPVQPATLFYYDISANSTLWGNQAYALFFNKKAVWVQPAGTKP